ncbi:beta-propeller fold lactonase family protein [Nostoc sp. UHCC 0870]|uniref:beta-propeller fold lactonase family protein n=1 Tax=Nostoc sp. UHCC 0870 TaxID=2914041 RepID=UPI001EDEEE83|nr:beta-propeller fold lactonase family protein [Nostoc sp. UHCC 0870]UKO97207.1 beta-propeller fold lactonase family protein [Nostoc sp. UHCC 0870]
MLNTILNFVEVQKNLHLASSVTISADGEFLYATTLDNPLTPEINESAIAVFRRDALTGKLSFVEAQRDDIGNINGLGGAYSSAISPDGTYLYVAGFDDAAIARFQRDTITGELIFIDFQQDDDLLGGVTAIAISPDSEFLYAIASNEESIAVFARDPITGELNFFEVIQDVNGLGGAYSLILSPDGKFIYTVGIVDEAIAVFERDLITDKLNFVEVQTGYTDSIDEPFIPYSLTISPDGKYLYGVGVSGVIAVFERDNSTGSLSLVELQEDAASDTEGLAGVNAITISPDGKFLYAAIFPDDAVAIFRRDAATGKLSFIEFQQDNTDGVDGLDGVFSLTTSPDGKFIYAVGFADAAVAVFSQNVLPTSTDTNIYTQPNSLYTFKSADFPFSDADTDDSLQAVQIVSLPQLGEFFLDSNDDQKLNDGELIAIGQTIQIAELRQLKFQTDKTAIGDNYTSFQFKVNDGAEDSNEANKLTINVQGTIINNTKDDIFTIKNSDITTKAKLQFELTKISANTIYELGVFSVDDAQGNINGIAPGTSNYNLTALERAKVVLFSLADAPNAFNPLDLQRIIEFNSGENFRFYLIPNSTTNEVLSGKISFSEVVFLSNQNIQVEDDGFSLNLSDFGVKIQTTQQVLPLGISQQTKHQGELIDLRGVTQPVKAEFIVNREAAFDNFVGFYQVVDENGGIDTNGDGTADILVGQAGYTQAAVRGRVSGIDLIVRNQSTEIYTGFFEHGAIFAPFMIVNSRPDAVLNGENNPAVYFPFLGANADKTDHIHLLGDNTFGFEDLVNGGDRDYNDMIVRVNLSFI